VRKWPPEAHPVGAFGGQKTQFDQHNLDGLYMGDTWSKPGNSGLGAYGMYLSQPAGYSPAGIAGE
jgi:hypothetical protein